MPATIVYSSRAAGDLEAMQEGGYSAEQIAELKEAITTWVDANYTNWEEGSVNHQSFHIKYGETVYAELSDPEAGEVTIKYINYA